MCVVCTYVCMHACVYLSSYVCMYVYQYTSPGVRVEVSSFHVTDIINTSTLCAYPRIYVCIYACMHACIYHLSMYVSIPRPARGWRRWVCSTFGLGLTLNPIYVDIHIHIYIYIYIYIYGYVYKWYIYICQLKPQGKKTLLESNQKTIQNNWLYI